MIKVTRFAFVLTCFAACLSRFANGTQVNEVGLETTAPVTAAAEAESLALVQIPFTMTTNGQIVAAMDIGDTKVMLLVDTGCAGSWLDSKRVSSLNGKWRDTIGVSKAESTGRWDYSRHYMAPAVKLGSVVVKNVMFHNHDTTDHNLAFRHTHDGELDGMLGADVLMSVRARIDYTRLTIDAFVPDSKTVECMYRQVSKRSFLVPVRVVDSEHKPISSVDLYLSHDNARTWQRCGSLGNKSNNITVTVDHDGYYLLGEQHRFMDGTTSPVRVSEIKPQARVLVRTDR